jgi:hypothetical protein
MKSGAAVHAREPGVIARCIAGETILVPARRRASEMALFTLNEVGTFVWDRIDGKTPRVALLRQLLACFDVDEQRAADDLHAFLSDLEEAGCLLQVSP